MKKFLKFIGYGFIVLIVLGVIASLGEDSTTTTEPEEVEANTTPIAEDKPKEEPKEEVKSFGLNEEVTAGKLSYIVHGAETVEVIESGNEFIEDLTTTGKFVIVDVTVKNNDKEARYIDSAMFRLIEGDGTEYSPSTEADMLINNGDLGFMLTEVNPKMEFRGKVAFEVHKEFTGKVQLSSGFGWSGGEYVEVSYE